MANTTDSHTIYMPPSPKLSEYLCPACKTQLHIVEYENKVKYVYCGRYVCRYTYPLHLAGFLKKK
jgi:ssDNA-binding Zn-finger/Zn-ribbon topoisomerase 1